MRLSILEHGHRRRAKMFLALTSGMSRVDSPDIVKMLLYRPGFLTRPLLELTAAAMRGPSYWTAGEREYLAMSTARLHQCPFCIDSHRELTRIAGHGEVDPENPASARPELRAVSGFLETVTLTPDHVDTSGVADLPEHALVEALQVNLVWNIVNRLANAFGFVLREGQLESGTRALHRFGYRFPGFLLAEGKTTDHGDVVANIRHAVVDDSPLRAAIVDGSPVSEPWQSYVTSVRDTSYKITDADIARLTAAGHTEDEIYEVTVAAAVGAALDSFDAGRSALARKTAG
ncbi:carboxymuconolactone decarboxylase family protein [Amycolatopsis sp. GM8]|uniref:carboxymuconolactone decarboxylase family protein n=1 Tax=Amycolatopsis sp. GM8 TaxID=2896530 RepID=UPI001F352C09|nr:hypothetical protein [Amycolatopsis sp. GM8]